MNFTNNAEVKLPNAVLPADSSLILPLPNVLPTLYPYPLTLTNNTVFEVVTITGLISSTATEAIVAVTRAVEGTTALSWAIGTTASNRITAGHANANLQVNGKPLKGLLVGENSVGGYKGVVLGDNASSGVASYSVVVGYNAQSTGHYGVSLGYKATASNESIAIGYRANAASLSVCLGNRSSANALGSISIRGIANGQDSLALAGGQTDSKNSISMGRLSKSGLGVGTIAIGYRATNTGNGQDNVVIGSSANCGNSYGTVLGTNTYSWWRGVSLGVSSKNYGNRAVSIGDTANAKGSYDVCIGYGAKSFSGKLGSIAIGKKSYSKDSNSIVIGVNAISHGADGTAIGRSSISYKRGEALGLWAYAGKSILDYGCVALGTNCYSQGGKYITSVGYRARSYAHYATALGAYSYNHGLNATSVGVYSYVAPSANNSVAIGYHTKSYGTNSLALGSYGVNNLPNSTMIQNPITIRKDTGSTTPARDFSATESVIMTNEFDLTLLGSATIPLPVGGIFLPSEIGIVCTTFTGTIITLTQATIELSTSTDNITYTPVQTATTTTALSNTRTFETLVLGGMTQGATYLRAAVTLAGTAKDIALVAQPYKARVFFKGIFLEE